jgi:hypothetical protein
MYSLLRGSRNLFLGVINGGLIVLLAHVDPPAVQSGHAG